ncbi:porin [Paraburkholderia saeva]|uniref:Outer membrane porin protein n=1 Tax=Paraburkholderia saeva TaxID=2777537 RepID=A0A9N8WZB4_9BURK|nr:porin [Paraburkholderia saeva]CAG4887941.1 Outer membrane porin protein [Paraburkholderia saeva]CAG4901626.1 Outer membrane porin protein [Paraburkholderia saeva]
MKKQNFKQACLVGACLAYGAMAHAQEAAKAPTFAGSEEAGFNPLGSPVSGDGVSVSGDTLQLYGLLSPTIAYMTANGARNGPDESSRTNFASNGSYWGIRGAEDLGSTWYVLFQLENTVNVGTGTNTNASGQFAGRDTFIGIQNDTFGVLKFGLLTSPLYDTVGTYKFLGDQMPIASPTTLMTTLNGTSLQFNNRVANAVLYATSKDSSGLVGHFLYTNSQSADPANGITGNADRVYSLSASYGAGPMYLQYVYESRANQDKLAQGSSNDWSNRIVGRYSFTSTFSLAFGLDYSGSDGTYGKKTAAGPGRVSRQAATVSLGKVVGNNEFIGGYAYARSLQCSGAAVGAVASCASNVRSGTSAQQFSLAYIYRLSKRTLVSAYISRIWNGSQGLYDFDSTPVVQSVSARTPGVNPTGGGVGITHIF